MPDDDPFDFAGSVGHNGDNDRADVIKAQLLLANAGELDLPLPGLPTGWAGDGLTRAVRHVQKANGLPVDGLLLPLRGGMVGEHGEGETLMSLRSLLGGRMRGQRIPTPQQVDGFFDAYARDPDAPLPYRTMEKRDGDPEPTLRTMEKRESDPEPRLQLLDASMTIEAPPSPPAAGEQTAVLPAALLPLLLTTPLAIGAGEYMRKQYEKSRGEKLTSPASRPLGDMEKEQANTPPLQPPQIDTSLQGRPAADKQSTDERLIPPETKDWISGLPPTQQPVAEGLAGIIVELNPHGSRGKPETEKANRIMVRTCLEELQRYPDLADELRHVAGATREGKEGGDYMKEEVIRSDGSKTFSRPDGTFGRLDAKERVDQSSPYTARMNTVDIKKTGDEHDRSSLTANEGRRFDKLENNIRVGVAGWARKMKPGEREADYAKYVASRCRAMWDDLDGKLRQDGLLPAR
ncbi:peptidoglycan-binding protein [Ferrovibrio terrae]|uniref:peptidoglycan-binding domain-containing protein n=1 Tax=Ferrovibrio terrae TaxID=2594003 RepID=UPI003138059F